MAAITLENIPPPLLEFIRTLARQQNRTLDEQIVVLLQKALSDPERAARARVAFDEIDRNMTVLPPDAADSTDLIREARDH